MKIAAAIISTLLLLAGCSTATVLVYDVLPNNVTEEGLVSIAWLKSLCDGRSTIIDKDVSIEGTVIANDLYGEFYKTIVILDDSGGIEIAVDGTRLHDDYHLYSQVAVFCHGLALGRVGGKVTLGAAPTGEYATDRIAGKDADRYIAVFDHRDMSDPERVKVGELSLRHVSTFVFIENLQAVEEERGLPWCDADSEPEEGSILTYTDRHFTDPDGDTLTVRTLNRCEYGDEPIPDGRISLAGIVDYFDGDYCLRIADHHILQN